MRNLKLGMAVAMIGSLLLGPLHADGKNRGFLSGEARAKAKQPYSDFMVRARNARTGAIEATAILDAEGNFALDGLAPGQLVVDLLRAGDTKVICSEGPFDIKPGATPGAAFGRSDISIRCNGPVAALLPSGPQQQTGLQQNRGFLSGDARAEIKQPYSDFAVRARNVQSGTIDATAIIDSQGNFLLDGLLAGKLMIELTKVGQNKVICSEGPYDIKPGATATDAAFGQSDISIKCNQPIAAWLLLAAAAAAGVTAGVVAAGSPVSGAQ